MNNNSCSIKSIQHHQPSKMDIKNSNTKSLIYEHSCNYKFDTEYPDGDTCDIRANAEMDYKGTNCRWEKSIYTSHYTKVCDNDYWKLECKSGFNRKTKGKFPDKCV